MGNHHIGSARSHPDLFVIVATKGRPREVTMLLECLERQIVLPSRVLVVGTCEVDFDLAAVAGRTAFGCHAWISKRMGTTSQRNEGIDFLREAELLTARSRIVFFDDDFRPADDWLLNFTTLLQENPAIVAMTGCVLADGVRGSSLSEEEARAYNSGSLAPRAHWTSGRKRNIDTLYGCNMGFRASTFLSCRFDEELPMYGWQEDRDIAGQAKRLGRVIVDPACKGVHLGAGGGRSSGLRFGYAQVANVIYLRGKGTVDVHIVIKFLLRAIASNIVHTISSKRKSMYLERLKGNALAISDLFRGTCYPRRIVELP